MGLRDTEQSENVNKNSIIKNLILLFITLLICFFIIEVSIRFLGDYDEDGFFSFRGYGFQPNTLPYNSALKLVQDYNKLEKPFLVHDPYLGWKIANSAKHPNGLYFSNSIGIRSNKEFTLKKDLDVVRIAAFGDSYIFGDDVKYEETMVNHLQEILSKKNKVEIMNFGVGGYGIDQAYLRWKLDAKKYEPDIVLIGFQAENCRRNLYIMRKIYDRKSGLPFFKPRFLLENSSLKLVNYPVPDYNELPNVIKNLHTNQLNKYESFYNSDSYKISNPLYYSKAVSLIVVFFKDFLGYENKHIKYYKADNPEMQLCYEIIKKFVNEASDSSNVYLIHIPKKEDIEQKLKNKNYFYEDFLLKLKKDFRIIDPSDVLVKTAKNNSIDYLFKGHYTNEGNKILAGFINENILIENKNGK